MKRRASQLLCLLLCLCLTIGLVTPAFAAETETSAPGTTAATEAEETTEATEAALETTAETEGTETVPETTAETAPETTAATEAEETIPETTAATEPAETEATPTEAEETTPETTAETEPTKTTVETAPKTMAEPVPETADETEPEQLATLEEVLAAAQAFLDTYFPDGNYVVTVALMTAEERETCYNAFLEIVDAYDALEDEADMDAFDAAYAEIMDEINTALSEPSTATTILDEVDEWGRRTTIVEIDTANVYFSTNSANSYSTIASAGAYVREQMKARETTISFKWTGSTSNMRNTIGAIFQAAVAHTGVPTEGDYLAWHYGGYRCGYTTGSPPSSVVFTMSYYTTAAQEKTMDSKVTSVLNSLSLSGKSEYQKIKLIYQYICNHVSYDSTNDDDYLLKYTAYAALVNRTAVCQGYATLLYRLLLEEGIDCRVITGTSSGENHAWNIIKLCAYYYNADATWDAGNTSYSYFLKCPSNFSNHTRKTSSPSGEDYTSDEFAEAYPMASINGTNNHSVTYTRTVTPTTSTTGLLTGKCSKCRGTLKVTMPKLNTTDYTYKVTTAATCTATGTAKYTWRTTTYGTQTITVSVDKAAHTWDSGKVTTAATCTATGVKTYTCTVCGATKTEEIAKIAHNYRNGKCTVCGAADPNVIAVYRLYNPVSGEHLLATDQREINTLTASGWSVDGLMCYMPTSGTPIYRLYNQVSGEHLYTMNESEIENLTAGDWTKDGVMCYSATEEEGTPIYRLYNASAPAISSHLLSTSQTEMDSLVAAGGWKVEGIALYAAKQD